VGNCENIAERRKHFNWKVMMYDSFSRYKGSLNRLHQGSTSFAQAGRVLTSNPEVSG